MNGQLHLPEIRRNCFKSQVSQYVDIYMDKLLPVFKDIEKDAEKYSNELFEDFMNQPGYDNSKDPSYIAEESMESGAEYYLYLKLGLYQLTATWHSTLYQLWEQQVRTFLFREESHSQKIDYKSYCTKIKTIKERFSYYGVEMGKLSCWSNIDELRLLCNAIKHSEGDSEQELRKKNSKLFKQDNFGFHVDLHKTTLLDEPLNISEMTLQVYKDSLLSFWDEIPERNYGKE